MKGTTGSLEPGARRHGRRVTLVAGDITGASLGAVINAANSALAGGGRADGAIRIVIGPGVMADLCER
jgi:O-acetyl-ADP-ribose deacetylase (regulator of RNase III)